MQYVDSLSLYEIGCYLDLDAELIQHVFRLDLKYAMDDHVYKGDNDSPYPGWLSKYIVDAGPKGFWHAWWTSET